MATGRAWSSLVAGRARLHACQILALGTHAHGIAGAVLLSSVSPVPEPGATACLLGGLLLLAWQRRPPARLG